MSPLCPPILPVKHLSSNNCQAGSSSHPTIFLEIKARDVDNPLGSLVQSDADGCQLLGYWANTQKHATHKRCGP